LFGAAIGGFLTHIAPGLHADPLAYTMVGMGAVAAAVVGAPVTMILLVLEMTANFYVAMGVMVAVFVSSTMARLTFGYSFATWRFHIRGVPIKGGVDIGWIHDLVVGRVMRRDIQTAPDDLPLTEFRSRFPLAGVRQVFLVDADGRYAGMVNTSDAHVPDAEGKVESQAAHDIAQGVDQFLLPNQTVRAALDRFTLAKVETLAVLDNSSDRHVVGFITEAFAQRQYLEALERSRADDYGDSGLFGPSTGRS
jgi:CIC family chloride channel protein